MLRIKGLFGLSGNYRLIFKNYTSKLFERKILIVLILVLGYSCNNKKNEAKRSGVLPIQEWRTIDDLIGSWTQLERDDKGYLLYKPCDGRTPGIEITKDSVILIPQIEDPIAMGIDEYDFETDSVTIKSSSPELKAEFTFKIVYPEADYVLLKWYFPSRKNKGKQILTRTQMTNNYRHIKDSCNTDKRPNLQFLPVEYD